MRAWTLRVDGCLLDGKVANFKYINLAERIVFGIRGHTAFVNMTRKPSTSQSCSDGLMESVLQKGLLQLCDNMFIKPRLRKQATGKIFLQYV